MENNDIIAAADQAQQINEVFNHKKRRQQVRTALKNQKYYITDNLGKPHVTSELKQITKKEKNNFKAWFARIKKAQEIGKKIERIHEEQDYNEHIKYMEEKEAKYLQTLLEYYGEEEGQKRYDKHLDSYEKRMSKKYGV